MIELFTCQRCGKRFWCDPCFIAEVKCPKCGRAVAKGGLHPEILEERLKALRRQSYKRETKS